MAVFDDDGGKATVKASPAYGIHLFCEVSAGVLVAITRRYAVVVEVVDAADPFQVGDDEDAGVFHWIGRTREFAIFVEVNDSYEDK